MTNTPPPPIDQAELAAQLLAIKEKCVADCKNVSYLPVPIESADQIIAALSATAAGTNGEKP